MIALLSIHKYGNDMVFVFIYVLVIVLMCTCTLKNARVGSIKPVCNAHMRIIALMHAYARGHDRASVAHTRAQCVHMRVSMIATMCADTHGHDRAHVCRHKFADHAFTYKYVCIRMWA